MDVDKIRRFYSSLDSKNIEEIIRSSGYVIDYLKVYSSKLKLNGLLQRILMIEWDERNQSLRDKAIVQAARKYIQKLLSDLNTYTEFITPITNSIKTAIADLFPTIIRLDKDFGKPFIIGNTNTMETSMQFHFLENLFFSHRIPPSADKYQIDHLTVPFLRALLESKIKQVLGIDILRDESNKSIEVSKILKLFSELKSIKLNKSFETGILKLIMEWLNHYMHRNIRPEPYVFNSVLEFLRPIFTPGNISSKNRKLYSINSSAFVEDLEIYHNEVELKLQKKFPNCFIVWTSKEVAYFKN
jgi:hypothetical protein